jgi:hypothetical protein
MSQTTFADGLGYEGKVTLTLKSDNRVLKSKTYKNNGTAHLFKFLGYCLVGSYQEVKHLVPARILLLDNNSASPETADAKNIVQRSAWTDYAQLPTIISESSPSQVRITYSFEVPRAAITGSFNQVALYGCGISDMRDFSAYYYLTDSSGGFDSLNIEEWSMTTVLLIEWELTISNKGTNNS